MDFRKPDMNIPVLYASLQNLKRPVLASKGPLEPQLPANKYARSISLAVYKASMAITDVLLKYLPQYGRNRKVSSSVEANSPDFYTPHELFLLSLHDLRSWDKLTEELEVKMTYLEQLLPGQELLILGGGISGLSLAWFVAHSRPDIKIKIIEKSDGYGGWVDSERIEKNQKSTVFEFGPRTLLPSHAGVVIATDMMRQLGILDKLAGIPKKAPVNAKGVYFNDELVELPSSLIQTVKMVTSHKVFDGMLGGLIKDVTSKSGRPDDVKDESVESFISRRTSQKIADNLVSAVLRGIYAGDVSLLSARSVTRFSNMYSVERVHGSSLISAVLSGEASLPDKRDKDFLPFFAQTLLGTDYPLTADQLSSYSMLAVNGGLQQMTDKLGAELERKFPSTVKLFKNSTISEIKPIHDGVELSTSRGTIKGNIAISTLPANVVAAILSAKKAEPAKQLSEAIPFTNIAVVDFWFPDKNIGKNWFGYLIPKTEDSSNPDGVIGVVFDSAIRNSAVPLADYIQQDNLVENPPKQAAQAPENGTTLTVMIGGPLWDDSLTKEKAIERAVAALRKQLGVEIKEEDYIVEAKLNRNCIPQYHVGHIENVERIQSNIAAVYQNRLYLSGTSYGRGVGIGDCIMDSLVIATRFSEQRKLLFADYYSGLWLNKNFHDHVA